MGLISRVSSRTYRLTATHVTKFILRNKKKSKMDLIKELRRNDTKSHGQIPTITNFNEDAFYRTMENIVDNHDQLFTLGKHIERLKKLEEMGVSTIEDSVMDETQEGNGSTSLS